MSIQDFPRVQKFIANLCASDRELHNTFGLLENALVERSHLSQTKEKLQRDVDNLRMDLMLVRQASRVRKEERVQIENVGRILESSYDHLLEISNLIDDEKIKNVIKFGVLQRQFEVQQKLDKIEQNRNVEMQCKIIMENRAIVQEFRQWQRTLSETQSEYSKIVMEYDLMNRQWVQKLQQATRQRNQKIVSLVQLSKQISEFQMPVSQRAQKHAKESDGKDVVRISTKEPLILQSAMDFINKYAEQYNARQNADNIDESVETPLRSILVVNRSMGDTTDAERTFSPTKQVHFAPLPSPIHTNAVEQMLNDLSMDMVDFNSESSHADAETKANTDPFPERAIVQKVEVLPPLAFSSRAPEGLSFKDLFPASKNATFEDDMKDELHKTEMSSTMLETMGNSNSMNFNDLDSLNLASSPQNTNDDFFFNFSGDKQSHTNCHSYDL